jgi:hypothetical protein
VAVKEAKIVECPALTNLLPEFKTTYDIEPHAELLSFDDSEWALILPAISASGAAAAWCRSSGSVPP